MSDTTAVFAGTFDPVTLGHLDLVRRGRRMFDRVIVSVVGGGGTLFTKEERIALLEEALADADGVVVEGFDGLIVEHARRHGARVLIRGMRGFLDFDYELQMAFANRGLADEVDTIFLPPCAEWRVPAPRTLPPQTPTAAESGERSRPHHRHTRRRRPRL